MRKFKVISESGHCLAIGTEAAYVGDSDYKDCVVVEGEGRYLGGILCQELVIGRQMIEIFED